MEFNGYLGIDVSKEKLDAALVGRDGAVLRTATVANTDKGLAKLLKSWDRSDPLGGVLFCLEPTGHYSNTAVAVLLGLGYRLWVANPADIRHSNGMQRGKNDRADALMIARYAHRFSDRARLSDPSEAERMELQQLLSHREMLVRDRARYSSQLRDYAGRIGREAYRSIARSHRRILAELENAIRDAEDKLDAMVAAMPEMNRQYGLLQSIPGVGKGEEQGVPQVEQKAEIAPPPGGTGGGQGQGRAPGLLPAQDGRGQKQDERAQCRKEQNHTPHLRGP